MKTALERQHLAWKLAAGTPVGRALIAAKVRLDEAGSASAHLDAQVILAHTLGVERSWLFAHCDYTLNAQQAERYAELLARRAVAEPVAYIVGHKEFYGLDLAMDRRVLIPRPETELLVDAVLNYIAALQDPEVRMVDVGTGSGAVALAVAANAPQVTIYAVDVSEQALAVAAHNVARLDGRGQVTLLEGDLLGPLPEQVDIIAANLPYIADHVYPELMADVREYEPRLALEAGPDGLDTIRRLLEQAPRYLLSGGAIFLEIGHGQGEAVLDLAASLLPSARYMSLRQDYHGRDRLVVVET